LDYYKVRRRKDYLVRQRFLSVLPVVL